MRRLSAKAAAAVVAVTCLALVAASAALAALSADGTGLAGAAAKKLGLPTSAAATATGSSSVRVTWSAPSGDSAPPGSYVVRRTAPTSAVVCPSVSPSALQCDDTGLSASTAYSYTVEARLGDHWTSGQTAAVSATTAAGGTPNFLVEQVSTGTKTAGTAFSVRLTARTGTTADTSYAGNKTIAFSGPAASPGGTAPTYPATVTFTAGVGTASVTLAKAESATLAATEGSRTGTVSVTVEAAAPAALAFTSSSPSCASGSVVVPESSTFDSKVSRLDSYGNPAAPASSVTVTVASTLSVTGSPLTIAANASESSGSVSVARPGSNSGTDVTASASGLTSATCKLFKNP
ncbi:MAG TPA: fibronectin type III domain-containing protein [Acidimicrobiales bacterium]|nr:fibronectin type III domain-containing protein [Acidimicrobiales bacterium]